MADLWGGEANAARVFHGFDHVVDKFVDDLIDGLDRAAFQAENGIAVLDDGKEHKISSEKFLERREMRNRGEVERKVPGFFCGGRKAESHSCAVGKLD